MTICQNTYKRKISKSREILIPYRASCTRVTSCDECSVGTHNTSRTFVPFLLILLCNIMLSINFITIFTQSNFHFGVTLIKELVRCECRGRRSVARSAARTLSTFVYYKAADELSINQHVSGTHTHSRAPHTHSSDKLHLTQLGRRRRRAVPILIVSYCSEILFQLQALSTKQLQVCRGLLRQDNIGSSSVRYLLHYIKIEYVMYYVLN